MKALMRPNKNRSVEFSIKTLILFAGVCALFVTQARAESERAEAEVECAEKETPLQYSCTIQLYERGSGKPLTGARIVINADMPDMPMAHNVPPVIAIENEAPGLYQATLILEMRGQWVLRLSVSGPLRDIIVVAMEFSPRSDHEHAPHQLHEHH